jgi:hypothetical protein
MRPHLWKGSLERLTQAVDTTRAEAERRGNQTPMRSADMSPRYSVAADVVVVLHVGFVMFVILGGLLALPVAPADVATRLRPSGRHSSIAGWVCR